MHVRIENDPYDPRYTLNPTGRAIVEPDLGNDGEDYEVLLNATMAATAANGVALEVGVRLGGGLAHIIHGLLLTNQARPIIGVDPYGGLPYDAADDRLGEDLDYTNEMMHDAMANIHLAAMRTKVDFTFVNLTDDDFMSLYRDGVPVYLGGKRAVWNEYAIVHIDGPHTTEAVMAEAMFFTARMGVDSVIVFDDVDDYAHDTVERMLFDNGFVSIGESHAKMAYQRREVVA